MPPDIRLSPEQQAVVDHRNGHLRVMHELGVRDPNGYYLAFTEPA
jgi:hypothetical protein